ncbi:MAG: type II secretion system protein [Candidatus Saccharibacteria bacterium]|nr:type II secretion system protein [Candidatus Saccharibacteria bacterium]
MKKKVGDTLIEVTLAIGIFSMVAITVASVVNGSTSSAQVALETTVTREQIDAQAEALRFIHNSYIAGNAANETGDDAYLNLWKEITSHAKDRGESLEYNPATCAEIYDNKNNLMSQGAFVIDINNIAKVGTIDPDQLIITPTNDNGTNKFFAAATYPRLVYSGQASSTGGDDALLGQGTGTKLERVEGLFIVPFKDQRSTSVVENGTVNPSKAAYYDFYIRSCWYGPGADRPSTISTVVRLYDPNIGEY